MRFPHWSVELHPVSQGVPYAQPSLHLALFVPSVSTPIVYNVCWQVVTPASTAPAKATGSSTAAGTSLASSVAQAAVQQPQVIGVRTLLEFVAWLVCSSGQAGAPGVQKGKPVTQLGMNSRQGVMFLTEELSDVGIAVRRLQVSRGAHAVHCLKASNTMIAAAKWVCAVNTIVHWVIRV